MKKILFYIPNLANGGAERVLVNLVNRMDRSKYDITVQTIFDTGRYRNQLAQGIRYKYNFKKQFRGSARIFKLFSKEFLFRRFIGNDYDIVVSYLESPTTRIVSGCTDPNIKLVSWVHNEMRNFNDFSVSFRSTDERAQCYKKFHRHVFVSRTSMQSFEKFLNLKNCSVIYNTVESDKIREMSVEDVDDLEFSNENIELVSVGRLIEQKGYLRLLNIMRRLVFEDGFKNIRLTLLGEGYLKNDLEKFIKEHSLANNVRLIGFKSNPYKYVKRSDLFVCSSLHEGYSTAVTEALIVGTPVITTLCSGMEELLQNGEYGIIVKNSEDDLYVGLRDLIANRSEIKRWAEKAALRGNDFSADKTVAAAEKFFDSL